jgi:hypothetical protein
MSQIEFALEWLDPMSARGEELRATWARFELNVDDEPITRLLDHSSRSVRSSIYLPLYPLAEWTVANWWYLFYEIETPGRSANNAYFDRHNLRSGASGYAVPSLYIRPVGGLIRLDWRPVRLQHQKIEFLGAGTGFISVEQLRDFLTNLVQAVIQRLEESGVRGTLVQEEWQRILASDEEEKEFCAASAALGLDPYALDEASQERILSVGAVLPASVSQDFFTAADFEMLNEQAQRLLEAIEASRSNEADLASLKKLRKTVGTHPVLAQTPWQQGYEFAKQLRREIGLNGHMLRTLSDIGAALTVRSDELAESVFETPTANSPFDAVVDVNEKSSPGFVISSRGDDALKFAFCRGLFEYLTCVPGEPLLVTRTRSERQKRNRAFAAEFLVPASILRTKLSRDTVGEEEVDYLAADFGVSPHVVIHQLENHRIARFLPA